MLSCENENGKLTEKPAIKILTMSVRSSNIDKDIFMRTDIFEDFNRETNQTAKTFEKGIDDATNGIDTILGSIQDFIIEKWDKDLILLFDTDLSFTQVYCENLNV